MSYISQRNQAFLFVLEIGVVLFIITLAGTACF
ncbi:MAG: hypothetical protein A4E28_02567 [Methanocella sp. PtaU1.Bin125]|nr:MAG: hypothetical protein A4E28_02567 [Methanocella sp. PtaU1.Bin125]